MQLYRPCMQEMSQCSLVLARLSITAHVLEVSREFLKDKCSLVIKPLSD